MINIVYLSHNRRHFHDLTFYFLNKIKLENKKKITLTILSSHEYDWNLTNLENINTTIKIFSGEQNYLEKIKFAINSECEYSIKLDEDCFINNHVWDFIIENIDILNDEDNLLFSPVMSNNIPSCDLFIEDYISDNKIKEEIYSYFLKRNMPIGLWGVDYSPLNKYTIQAKNWESDNFYRGVSELPTKTKGIHPLRITYEAQVAINKYILSNPNLFIELNNYEFIELIAPYFTNSLFAIKTNEWKKILSTRDVDGYDEIALNTYKRDTGKKFLFIKNGFGIHPMYNTVFGNKNPWNIGVENGELLELEFYNNLKKMIIK